MIKYKIIDKEIIYTKLPKEIFNEVKFWKKSCDKIKNHPLSKLKLHDNGGTKTNNYQVSVPSLLVVNSYWLAFVIRLCSIITNENHRNLFSNLVLLILASFQLFVKGIGMQNHRIVWIILIFCYLYINSKNGRAIKLNRKSAI